MRIVFIVIGFSLVIVVGASVWMYESQFHTHQELYKGNVYDKDNVVIDGIKSFVRSPREKVICYRESHRNFYIFIFELSLALVAITIIGILNSTKLNRKLTLKNQEIENQRLVLHEQQENYTAGIRYAKLVQMRYLKSEEILKNVHSDLFIHFEPKEIVSGDFYKVFDFKGLKWFVVGDCSGHGVQGAFLSNFLMGEIRRVIDSGLPAHPSDFVNILNKSFCINFGGILEESFSAEIGILAWKPGTQNFKYSSTKIDLLMIQPNKEKQWLKGSRVPLGFDSKVSYVDFLVEFEPNTNLFFATDGITDQFGGEENKKWGKKNVARVFEEASILPVDKRKGHIVFSLNQWKIDQEATDDITLLGIQFPKSEV